MVTLGFKDRAPEIERQVQHIEAGVHNVSSHISTDHDFISEARSGRFPDLEHPYHQTKKK